MIKVVALILLFVVPIKAELRTFKSGDYRTSLIELYSSEGCSSCPPAERWLSQLKKSEGLWSHFVPVAFHVDYWDYIGWKDKFASHRYTTRQRSYASLWGASTIYTPGFVLNGLEWRNWRYFSSFDDKSNTKVGQLKVSESKPLSFSVNYTPPTKELKAGNVHAALLGFNLVSNVKAGENRGKRLEHDFVVLDFTEGRLAEGKKGFGAQFNLKKPKNIRAKKLGIAVWITGSDSLTPIQATGGFLN